MALDVADHGYVMENGRIVFEGAAESLRLNAEVKEFYLGLNESGLRRSYRDVKRYRRRKRLSIMTSVAQSVALSVAYRYGDVTPMRRSGEGEGPLTEDHAVTPDLQIGPFRPALAHASQNSHPVVGLFYLGAVGRPIIT